MVKPVGPFRFLADPVCMTALGWYALNRFVLKPNHIGGWFTHGYLNDVLCLPLFVPMILWVQHLVGLRRHAGYPRAWEILQGWAAFTLVFQMVIPRFPGTFITAGDPWDMVAYLGGGILAWGWWFMAGRGVRWRRHLGNGNSALGAQRPFL